MKKRILNGFLAAAVSAVLLCSCTGAPSVSTPTETEAPVAADKAETDGTTAATSSETEAVDYSSLSEEEIYNLMVKRSLLSMGDMTRMANVFDRAAKGEDIKIAYIGGSITEGYSDNITLKTEEKWVDMSTKWLGQQFPKSEISYVNAGLSGTPSILGNVRLERDVLVSEPDIVFVEFAVNDGADTVHKNAYESLVRTLLTQDKDIAVVLLFTIVENGHTCQPHMSKIGEHYGLPMISLPDSMWVEIKEGRMAWSDYSADRSHPNVEGSVMIRDFVTNYFNEVLAVDSDKTGTVDKTLPEPLYSGAYMNMKFLDNTNAQAEISGFEETDSAHHWFGNGWQFKGDTGASLKLELECSKLALVFKANDSKIYGEAEIYVDGELTEKVNSNKPDGWSNPVTEYIVDNEDSAAHTVEIVIPEGQKCYYGILGFGYCK